MSFQPWKDTSPTSTISVATSCLDLSPELQDEKTPCSIMNWGNNAWTPAHGALPVVTGKPHWLTLGFSTEENFDTNTTYSSVIFYPYTNRDSNNMGLEVFRFCLKRNDGKYCQNLEFNLEFNLYSTQISTSIVSINLAILMHDKQCRVNVGTLRMWINFAQYLWWPWQFLVRIILGLRTVTSVLSCSSCKMFCRYFRIHENLF